MSSQLSMRFRLALFVAGAAQGVSFTLRSAGTPTIPTFEEFMRRYNKSYAYGTAELEARRSNYLKNVAGAQEHNYKVGKSWTARVNKMWDWSDEELASLQSSFPFAVGSGKAAQPGRTSFLDRGEAHSEVQKYSNQSLNWSSFEAHKEMQNDSKQSSNQSQLQAQNGRQTVSKQSFNRSQLQALTNMPTDFNWLHLKAMKRIREQGYCGSCWAVAATTTLEAHAESRMGVHRTFSTQQVVSCMPNPLQCGGGGGCGGATVDLALQWVATHGCAEESQEPYTATEKHTVACPSDIGSASFNIGAVSFSMSGWERLPENKEAPIVRALYELGPVAISVASGKWYYYGSGIFDDCEANPVIGHSVVLIGYGEEGTQKYWTIQNSWGADWGENGNIRLRRLVNEEYQCGVDKQPENGDACMPYPEQITVCGSCGIIYAGLVPHFG